jgi:hypothetical protein
MTRSWRSSKARRAWLFTAVRFVLPNSFTRFGLWRLSSCKFSSEGSPLHSLPRSSRKRARSSARWSICSHTLRGSLSSRWRDAEFPADPTGEDISDLRVAGDRNGTAIVRVVPDGVVAALALQGAAVASHALFEIAALHGSSGIRTRFTASMLLGSALYLRPHMSSGIS